MQTGFTLAQLNDPRTAESNRILRACVHCGFCTATCPTYVLLGDELDSPRGRIYLIKDMLEEARPATPEVVKHIDRCLSCLSCMTTCPSGVHYMHLLDHARSHIEATYRRPLPQRLVRAALARVLPYPRRFYRWTRLGQAARPLGRLMSAVGLRSLAAMLELVPAHAARPPAAGRRVFAPRGRRAGRVALLTGCVSPVLAPRINEAAIRVLNRHGIEVVLPAREGCCGGLVHQLGRTAEAHAFARANVDAWTVEIEREGLDAILITASGCGTMVKDYGFLLRTEEAYAAKAKRVSALAADVCEYLARLPLATLGRSELIVAYHSACSLQHGQKITREPKELLCKLGFVVKDVPEGHLCCGSAGTYNISQPDIARRLRDRKIANIEKVQPDVIAAGNIGCIAQLAGGTAVPVVHTVELIDWATGGPAPDALRGTWENVAPTQATEAVL
jgi:glycolate oxidase iron-sulfur subunit